MSQIECFLCMMVADDVYFYFVLKGQISSSKDDQTGAIFVPTYFMQKIA